MTPETSQRLLFPLPFESLEKKIHIKFKNRKFIEEALTHRSYVSGSSQEQEKAFNERMEFLGDSILNAAITDFLYKRYPAHDEGKLSKFKSLLVSQTPLARWAKEIKLGAYLKLSGSEELQGGRERDSILADALEAVIGAIYLDQGFEKAKDLVIRQFEQKKRIVETDFKSRLQELIQKKYKVLPIYILSKESGPDHDKTFFIEVRLKKKMLGKGTGKSKKESEQSAARQALRNIRDGLLKGVKAA
ncbi:MAG: ribonuclease III [Elusimicrobia bacterium]|nr:ribonuclease III [Elusimicrobiota bacterium]